MPIFQTWEAAFWSSTVQSLGFIPVFCCKTEGETSPASEPVEQFAAVFTLSSSGPPEAAPSQTAHGESEHMDLSMEHVDVITGV